MHDYETLIVTDDEGLRTVLLNRPKQMNAANPKMLQELTAVLTDAESNEAIRCLLIGGEGRAFCSGRDLSSAKADEDAYKIITEEINPVLERLYRFPKPTIAAINGVAMGVGLGLALACDIIYAADNARLSSPFANLGVALDSGGHYFLPRMIGYNRAMEMVYTADIIRGRRAAEWGLVNRSVPGAKLREWATALGKRIAAGPTNAYAGQKALMQRAGALDYPTCMDEEAKLQASLVGQREYAEGLAAFRGKRRPDFRKLGR
jgi:2-(1,2-epoxy-1,2-dihydrophenyl)acetyl-CoA isomerase